MAQKKKIIVEDTEEIKPVIITSASIKEDLCNYGYEINIGSGKGDKITRKGSSLVHEDMHHAFSALNCHLAIIDDAFSSSDKFNTLDEIDEHDITSNFSVTGFKVVGSDENEGFILIGEKMVTVGSIGLETPKIGKHSNYDWFDELKEGIENARQEVEQYMNGKTAPALEQAEIGFPSGNESEEFDNPL